MKQYTVRICKTDQYDIKDSSAQNNVLSLIQKPKPAAAALLYGDGPSKNNTMLQKFQFKMVQASLQSFLNSVYCLT